MTGFGKLLSIAGFGLVLAVSGPAVAGGDSVEVLARTIPNFKIGSTETKFGPLRFIGGIEMNSDKNILGAFSSIRMLPNGQDFIGVLDTGHWVRGSIARGDDGAIKGIVDMTITSMLDAGGDDQHTKWAMDSEGIAIDGRDVLVSFERLDRVDRYPLANFDQSRPSGSIPLLIDTVEFRNNGGLETIVVSPADSPLQGAPVIVAERSVNKEGNLFAAVLDGPQKGIFFVKRTKPFSVTDGTFLPNGDLLLLERRFGLADGIGMQIRRIKANDIVPDATVDGEVLINVGGTFQIDNMEGLDAFVGPNGKTRLIMVSDDNHSLFQRNLMLEFELDE